MICAILSSHNKYSINTINLTSIQYDGVPKKDFQSYWQRVCLKTQKKSLKNCLASLSLNYHFCFFWQTRFLSNFLVGNNFLARLRNLANFHTKNVTSPRFVPPPSQPKTTIRLPSWNATIGPITIDPINDSSPLPKCHDSSLRNLNLFEISSLIREVYNFQLLYMF